MSHEPISAESEADYVRRYARCDQRFTSSSTLPKRTRDLRCVNAAGVTDAQHTSSLCHGCELNGMQGARHNRADESRLDWKEAACRKCGNLCGKHLCEYGIPYTAHCMPLDELCSFAEEDYIHQQSIND